MYLFLSHALWAIENITMVIANIATNVLLKLNALMKINSRFNENIGVYPLHNNRSELCIFKIFTSFLHDERIYHYIYPRLIDPSKATHSLGIDFLLPHAKKYIVQQSLCYIHTIHSQNSTQISNVRTRPH